MASAPLLTALDNAIDDLHSGLKLHRVWMMLAHEDIGDQHRRTVLGPLWLLINYLAFVGTFFFFFPSASHTVNYPAYIAVGLFVWFYIMETISQSVTLFTREESFIKGTTLPLSVYVFRLTMQSIIRASYALIGCAGVLALSGVEISSTWAWALLGIGVIIAVTPAAVVICAFLGAYFPDSQYIVSNLMRIGMFLTPVFWIHDGTEGGIRHAFYYWNPFTYFLEIVREPILSNQIPMQAFAMCAAISILVWGLALLLLGLYRKQIVFVV
jgi:lipopolysaccharide transport system permease protein